MTTQPEGGRPLLRQPALRTGTPIFGAEQVLDEAGIMIEDEQEDEVERFIEFLDQISPEDFGAEPGGPAAGGGEGGEPGG